MKKHFIFFLILISSLSLFSQRGKDGAGNIVAANTIVNLYTPLTASINAGATSISVGSTVGFAVGDLVMIIQMQGASVRANKWWFTDTTATAPPDTSQGYILNYNEAGNHEFAQVNSVLSANSLSLDCGILKKYTTVGKTQV
ncbi:MAG TPA: hypothetical protein VN026_17500, partial [Bacteroidia bacterium]|nr:hypothetical protein [Bacteroidia bacterium]